MDFISFSPHGETLRFVLKRRFEYASLEASWPNETTEDRSNKGSHAARLDGVAGIYDPAIVRLRDHSRGSAGRSARLLRQNRARRRIVFARHRPGVSRDVGQRLQ